DVLSYELDSNRAATLERYVGELLTAGLPLDGDRDDLILLLGTSATHLVLPVCTSLHGLDVLFGRIVWSIRRHPENELVERQHGNGCQVLPAERCPRAQRRGEQVRQCDDDLMWVAFAVLDLEEAFRTGAARLVDHHDGLVHQLMLADDSLDEPGHLISTAASSRRDDEGDRLGRLPCQSRWCRHGEGGCQATCYR